jgi:hypothetical protein
MSDIILCDGKYTLRRHADARMEALRYGEPWRELSGDNLVYWLANEIDVLRNALSKACGDDAAVVAETIESQR